MTKSAALLAIFLAPTFTLLACATDPEPGGPAPQRSDAASAAGGTRGDGTGGNRGTAGAGGGTGGAATPGSGGGGGQAGQPGQGGQAGGAGQGGTSGSGGSTRDGGRPPRADAAQPPADARPAVEGGSAPSADLDQRCTVPITFRDRSMGNEGGKIFMGSVPDVTMVMQQHSRSICRILYRKVEEVKNVTQQGLTIEPNTTIAFAAASNITFSTDYIASFSSGKNKAAIDAELNGVLVHEGTHVWQYTNGGGALVEAMADYVRYKAGFYTLARRRPGGNWNQPYTTGGFFIAWMEEKYDPDLGYKINMGMKERGFSYPNFIQQLTGKSIDAIWAEYQAAIR